MRDRWPTGFGTKPDSIPTRAIIWTDRRPHSEHTRCHLKDQNPAASRTSGVTDRREVP